MKKLLYGGGAVVVALVLLALLALYHDFDSPELGNRLIAAVGNATGIELSAETFHLTPARGLWLTGVRARGTSGGSTFTAELDELVFEHRFWPLLRGDVVIERVILNAPRLELVTSAGDESAPPAAETPATAGGDAGAAGADSATEAGAGISLQVGEVAIVDGVLSMRNQDTGDTLQVTDLDVTLRELALDASAGPGLAGFAGRGQVAAQAISAGTMSMAVTSGTLVADRGRVTIANFAVASPAGEVTVSELAVDTTGDVLTYSLAASADDIDPNVLLGIPQQDALGNGALTLNARGTGVALDGAVADGSLQLSGGAVPDIGPLARVDEALGTSIVGAAYQPVQVAFSLADAVLVVQPFTLESDLLRLAGDANADLRGPLSGHLVIGVPRSEVREDAGVARNVLDAITNDDAWLNIPAVIGGTLSEPSFAPDTDAITQAVADAGRRVAAGAAQQGAARLQQEVREGIGGLLGRGGGR